MTAPIGRVDEDRIRQFLGVYRPGRAELTVAGVVRGSPTCFAPRRRPMGTRGLRGSPITA